MSDTYIGWDGKQYPWPPPEGWYHAIDNRWWAPGTGPNPPRSADVPSSPTPPVAPAANAGPGQHFSAQTVQVSNADDTDHGNHAQAPHGQLAAPAVQPVAEDTTSAMSHTNVMPRAAQPGPGGQTPGILTNGPDGYGGGPPPYSDPNAPIARPGGFDQPPQQGGGLGSALLIIGGIVAATLVGGLAYFLLTSGGTETETATDGSTPDSETTTPTSETTTPTSDTAPTDTTDENPSDSSTSTTATIEEQVVQFRAILADNDLTSENLSDDDIRSFATSFCGLAAEAEDEDAFDETRAGAIDSTTSELSAGELSLIIDAAVVTFCPAEAQRLDVRL